jgi:hypothetical protein
LKRPEAKKCFSSRVRRAGRPASTGGFAAGFALHVLSCRLRFAYSASQYRQGRFGRMRLYRVWVGAIGVGEIGLVGVEAVEVGQIGRVDSLSGFIFPNSAILSRWSTISTTNKRGTGSKASHLLLARKTCSW